MKQTNQELAQKIAQRLIWKSTQMLSISLALPISDNLGQLVNLMNNFNDIEEMDYWTDVIRESAAKAILEVLDEERI